MAWVHEDFEFPPEESGKGLVAMSGKTMERLVT